MPDARLLAVDLDGTLLRRDGSIAPEDSAAIQRARAAGIAVTIVTGRLYSGSRAAARALELSGPIACVDGCHIVEAGSDATLFTRTLGGSDAHALRDLLAPRELATFLFANDRVVHDPAGDPFAAYVEAWSADVTRVERVTEHAAWAHADGIAAALALGPAALIEATAAAARAALGDSAFVVAFPISRSPGRSALIVRASGPTKGTAIAWLAEHHGIAVAEVAAIGDWWNDLPMFAAAGRSFAMAGTPEPIRAAASDRLEAIAGRGGGVAEAVRALWGI